jgi:hypothetical protein
MSDHLGDTNHEHERQAADAERARRQRMRSIAIAIALALMAVLFNAATIVRLGGNVANRAL